MNAQGLFKADGSSAEVWYCGECKIVRKTEKEAEECCKKHNCRICGSPVDTLHRIVHPECKRQETIEKAQKLESWDGWVYWEGIEGEYFDSIDDLLEAFEDNHCHDIPEFVFTCKPIHFRAPDVEDLIAGCLDGHYEDAYDAINKASYRQLSEALSKFEKDNSHIVSYEPDFTKMVRVRE